MCYTPCESLASLVPMTMVPSGVIPLHGRRRGIKTFALSPGENQDSAILIGYDSILGVASLLEASFSRHNLMVHMVSADGLLG